MLRTVTKYSFELLVPHLSISISSYCYWKKQKNQTKKNKYILRTHNTSLNEKHAPAPPPPQADSSASGEVWKHLAAGSRWFPSLHLLIKSINHVRQPCRAPCLTRGQQTARNEPTEESLKPRNTVRQQLKCPRVTFKDVLTEYVRENKHKFHFVQLFSLSVEQYGFQLFKFSTGL